MKNISDSGDFLPDDISDSNSDIHFSTSHNECDLSGSESNKKLFGHIYRTDSVLDGHATPETLAQQHSQLAYPHIDHISFTSNLPTQQDYQALETLVSTTFGGIPGSPYPVKTQAKAHKNTGNNNRTKKERGYQLYSHAIDFSNGIHLEYSYPTKADNSPFALKMRFTVPGSVLGQLSILQQIQALKTLLATPNVKLTRVDLSIDFFNFPELLAKFECARATSSFFGATKTRVVGSTIYFGSKDSDKQLRIYDKALQLKINSQWLRYELQLRNDYSIKAIDALMKLINDGENISVAIALIATDEKYFDFKDKTNKKRDRCKRSDWWEQLLPQKNTTVGKI
ncbi:replication initiation factor domain-containing protein [Aulosira sp. FACHB-615]|uniref:replication initiation factor domain-containing protein n=1 Tax=Aulosira sp. FACHB-615 TaxID=2692777 RepID=UPI001683FCCC|nr:replication initiation factor domain-containing protein [Aulosira sp. FACHB-615]MBD2487157.1 replication initiation factor domain-containing protein [Aulosira sp. FACHB-615]